MSRLSIHLFGGCRIALDGESLRVNLPEKVWGLLAYLGLESDRPLRRENLAGLFWPDASEQHARHSLSQALYSIERALSPNLAAHLLSASHNEICFNRVHCQLDVDMFDALLQKAMHHQHAANWSCPTCLEHLQTAVDLYQTGLLSGLNLDDCREFSEWLLPRREDYQEKFIQACAVLARGYQAKGEFDHALEFLRRQVEVDPLYEPGHRQVMEQMCKMGRYSEALAQYDACKQIMEAELGIQPDHETFMLYTEIITRRLDAKGELPARLHNLSNPLTPLIGRQADIDQLCHLLVDPCCRLVTVLGSGGSGKTSLALAAGQALLPFFDDGVFLAELDACQPGESFNLALARAVGMEWDALKAISTDSHAVSLQALLLDYLRHRHMLLILDGFESVLPSTGLVVSLLRAAGGVKLLITSQVRLDLQTEWVYALSGLDYPPGVDGTQPIDQYAAVQLFLLEARRCNPSFDLSPGGIEAIGEICRQIQGNPLGILLAAGWVDTLAPCQILLEIQRSLDFLSIRWGDLPERQHSLRATFDYSIARLSLPEQEAVLHLAVFNSPFSADRARQVAGVSPQVLKRLTGHSLLQPAAGQCLQMHNLLRQYSMEKLASSPDEIISVNARHSQVILSVLADQESALKSRDQFDALASIDFEYKDIYVAWRWACEHGQVGWLEDAFDALEYYHYLRGLHEEAVGLCQNAIMHLETAGIEANNARLWLNLSLWLFFLYIRLLRYPEAWQVLQAVEELLRKNTLLEASLHRELARLSLARARAEMLGGGERSKAIPHLQRCLEHIYRTENTWEIAKCLSIVASHFDVLGYIHEALRLSQTALSAQRPLGDPALTASILVPASWSFMRLGDFRTGMRLTQELLTLRERLKDRVYQAQSNGFMAIALFYSGQYELVRSLADKALQLYDQPYNRPERAFYRLLLDCVDLMTGDYSAVLNDQAFAGEPMDRTDEAVTSWCRGCAHVVYQQWDQAEQELHHYLEYCQAITRLDMAGMPMALLGYIAHRCGSPGDARVYLIQALENGLAQGFYWVLSLSLGSLAVIQMERGEKARARALFDIVMAHPTVTNSVYFQDVFGRQFADLEGPFDDETFSLPQNLQGAAQYLLDLLRRGDL
jgi:DNA-binding SARP family transcriptional activator/predicted ATPase